MKKQIISIIAASVMLAVPNIHAEAGYHFHFDASKPSWTSKELLQPDRFYTEHLQPKDTRPNPEYVAEIFKMKEVMGIKTLTIIKNEAIPHNPRALASARNYAFYSCLRLNEKALARESVRSRTHDNTATIAHELSHIKNQDHRTQYSLVSLQDSLNIAGNAALCSAGLSLLSRTKRHLAPLTLLAGFITKFTTQETIKKIDDIIDDLEPQSDQEALDQRREHELAAEIGAYKTLAQCGYCEAIKEAYFDIAYISKNLKKQEKSIAEIENFRPNGHAYPMIKESISFMADAFHGCMNNKSIDPSTTKDTPNLMRNGSQL